MGGISNPAVPGATLTIVNTNVFNSTTPGVSAWTDLDLSGVIGSNEALVLLKMAGSVLDVHMRKNGDTDDFTGSTASAWGTGSSKADTTQHTCLWVPTDSAGIIEWKASATAAAFQIDVLAYIN